MPYIRTDRTGVGFNTGQTGTETSNGGGGGDPVLLTDLVAGWALTSNANQTLSSAGVVASGPLDLTNNNGVTFNSDGASITFDGAFLDRADAASLRLNNTTYFSLLVKIQSDATVYLISKLDAATEYASQYSALSQDFSFYVDNGTAVAACPVPFPTNHVFIECYYQPSPTLVGVAVNGAAWQTQVADASITGAGRFEVGAAFGGTGNTDCWIKFLRMWKGANASTILNSEVYRSWLYNSGNGRTDAEIAAYTG